MKTEFYEASLLSNSEMRYGVSDELLLCHRDKSQYLGSAHEILKNGNVSFRLYYPGRGVYIGKGGRLFQRHSGYWHRFGRNQPVCGRE